jgi:hypothetical protein
MAEVKVMRARADGPGAVKGECWVLTDGSEQPGDHPVLRMAGFAEFGPQNSAVAVPKGTGGGTRHVRGGCIKAKQLRVKDVVVGSKT